MAQIGTIGLETGSGTVNVPVFDTADAGSSVYDMVRVETPSGVGFIPFVDPADASFPYLRLQTQNQGILAAHDAASLSATFLTVTSTLNGETVNLFGYEDTTGDGSADNTDSWTLTGGTEDLDISAFDLSTSNEIWFEVETTDDANIEDAVTQIDLELEY